MLKQPVKTTRYSLALLALALGSSARAEAIKSQAAKGAVKTSAKSKGRHRSHRKQRAESNALLYAGVSAAALTAFGLTQLLSTATPSNMAPTPCCPQIEPQAPAAPTYYHSMQSPKFGKTGAPVGSAKTSHRNGETQTVNPQLSPFYSPGRQGGSGNGTPPFETIPTRYNTPNSGANTPTPLSNPAASAPQPAATSTLYLEQAVAPSPTPQTLVSIEETLLVKADLAVDEIKEKINKLEQKLADLNKKDISTSGHLKAGIRIKIVQLKNNLKTAEECRHMAALAHVSSLTEIHPQTPARTQATNNPQQRPVHSHKPAATSAAAPMTKEELKALPVWKRLTNPDYAPIMAGTHARKPRR